MIEIARLLHISLRKEREEKTGLCEKHDEVLTLFCEEDLELLCALCAQPPDHQGHYVRPIKEAASHHRKTLQSYMESLKRQVADDRKLLVTQDQKQLELRERVEHQRQKLSSEFEYLNQFVENEQQAVISKLAKEERDIERKLNENKRAFSNHISKIKGLITEVAEKSMMSEVKLLTDIKSIFQRCESLKSPALFSFRLRKEGCSLPLQFSALKKIRQKFREEVTLDPETAHPNLLVSEDKKCVTFVQREELVHLDPVRFMAYPVVLGSEGFSSGRHYWEVRVEDKPEWTVGVCQDSISRKGKWPLSSLSRCWMIQLHNGVYVAQCTVPITLWLMEKPTWIGIYLDYELGEISFYSVNDRSHIHSFMDTFSEALKPYFGIGYDSKPLTICEAADCEG
ncbi:Tripartite motif-containing protein 60 [Sciurus carolinensis]|uniref:Tripartite motif-containing protein 60 n=1 Tax=Sciurus carolinensis TaxID=30640 RepID=A0AA41MHB2_SCICA|nr:Tripartite motif-containing protein 60 [Sciurus carolinensis]